MPKPTMDQKRAGFALGKIKEVLDEPDLKRSQKFLIELRRLPAQLHWGGLGQAAASLLTDPKKNKHRVEIYHWLECWLRETGIYRVSGPVQPSLIQAITGSGEYSALQDRYVAATREARAIAAWLKKFAEAFLREPEKNDNKGDDHGAAAASPSV
jgi:CRISPR/Cas system CMR-associated protein Cmr5 small subunit